MLTAARRACCARGRGACRAPRSRAVAGISCIRPRAPAWLFAPGLNRRLLAHQRIERARSTRNRSPVSQGGSGKAAASIPPPSWVSRSAGAGRGTAAAPAAARIIAPRRAPRRRLRRSDQLLLGQLALPTWISAGARRPPGSRRGRLSAACSAAELFPLERHRRAENVAGEQAVERRRVRTPPPSARY